MRDDALSVVVCGSSAAMDLPGHLGALRRRVRGPLRALLTHSAERFVPAQVVRWLTDEAYTADADDLNPTELALRSRAVIVLPATAHMLASAALGLAATPAQTVVLAARTPVLFFPAMNEVMWDKPVTRRHLATLRGDGHAVVDPYEREAYQMWSRQWGPGRVLPPPAHVAKIVLDWLGEDGEEGGDGE
jgi:phosphopantothenoylcysteine synthetase/decarboxylase